MNSKNLPVLNTDDVLIDINSLTEIITLSGNEYIVIYVSGSPGGHKKISLENFVSFLNGGESFIAEAVNLDGARIGRNSSLYGASDSANGLCSFWIGNHTDQNGNVIFRMFPSSGYSGGLRGLYIEDDATASKDWNIRLSNGSGTTLFNSGNSTSPNIDDGNWHHVLIAWELDASPVVQIYVDDTAASYTPTTSAMTGSVDWTIASVALVPSSNFEGDISEFYATNEYLDISVEANRRKFISADGKPVDLGSDGSIPTGTAPLIYLSGGASAFNGGTANKGSGGAFNDVSGTVTDSSNEPVES